MMVLAVLFDPTQKFVVFIYFGMDKLKQLNLSIENVLFFQTKYAL